MPYSTAWGNVLRHGIVFEGGTEISATLFRDFVQIKFYFDTIALLVGLTAGTVCRMIYRCTIDLRRCRLISSTIAPM